MNKLAYVTLLGAALAGCANAPSEQAAIEERGIKAEPPKTAEIRETETKAVVTPLADKSTAEVKPVEPAPAPARPAEKVETRALAADATQVKPLEPGQKAGAAPAPAPAAQPAPPAMASVKQDETPAAPNLQDPGSLLAKRRILFDYDSAAIGDEYRGLLEAHAQYLQAHGAAKVILQGHTDERGSREYNLALGQRRAESVLKAMNLLGAPESQIEAVSLGEEKPLNEGHDDTAWAENRRAEIIYQTE